MPQVSIIISPGLLYVPFGWERPERLRHDERKLLHPSVQLVRSPVEAIDVDKQKLRLLHDGTVQYDYLVIATGSCPVPDEIPRACGRRLSLLH
jgi:sulfide:quinone oxidoreductase